MDNNSKDIFSNNVVPGEKKAATCTMGLRMWTINQTCAWREIINKVWTDGKCQWSPIIKIR